MLVAQGCKSARYFQAPSYSREPTYYEQLGVTPDTPSGTRRGYLSELAMQHLSFSDHDDYLDLYDEEGNWRTQIVVIFAENVSTPTDRTRPIEVTGPVVRIERSGPPNTKGSYATDVVVVETWKYVDSTTVPRKNTEKPKVGLHPSRPPE